VTRTLWPAAWVVALALSLSCATAPKAAAPRDRFPLDPREGLAGPPSPAVDSGWEALASGDARRARDEFDRALAEGPSRAASIGRIETLVLLDVLPEARESCTKALGESEPTLALLTACGEAQARSGQPFDGWELYRRAASMAPDRPGFAKRTEELRTQARDQMRREAQTAAGEKDWASARRAAAKAIELDPASAPARETAGDVERDAGDSSAALRFYQEAADRDPSDTAIQQKVAKIAVSLSDWSAAVPVLDRLAASDPKYAEQAAQARLAFRVANWPEAERGAARSPRLTRGDAARLTWWMVPEVREASVATGVIASDVVGRPDAREIARAVSLGLLDVDADTHRARPDAPLSLSAEAKLYLRLVLLLRRQPPACFASANGPVDALASPEMIRVARACALVDENDPTPLSGASFTRGLDRVREVASGSGAGSGR
jgi:tetratricopeptide (TPR) repeat protein